MIGDKMNRFYKRYSDIIFYLLSENKWNSLAQLADKTGFSKSTIWRDLEFLETILPDDWKLEKHETFGIRLSKPESGTLESILGHIREKNSYFHTLKLILLNDGVDISQISQEVHISRSTAYRHIEKLQDVLQEAELTLTASPFKLVGDEKNIRRFIIQYLDLMAFKTEDAISSVNFEEFQTALLKQLSNYSMSLRTGALLRLKMIIYISNLRVSMGYFVSFSKSTLAAYEESKFFLISKDLVHFMAKSPSREIQLQEILFFAIYLMSEERPINRSQHLRYLRGRKIGEREHPFAIFLDSLSTYVGFNLTEDDIFLFHIYQTLKRISLENEFKTETIRNSMLQYLPYYESNTIFQTIEERAIKAFSKVPLIIKKLDVLEIFTLLQAAILRKKNQHTIQVALVCRTYYEKDYIREILKYQHGNHLAISTLDASSMDLISKYEEFDLIISTDYHDSTNLIGYIPTIKVSTFPTPSELMEINEFIQDHFFEQIGLDKEMVYPFEKRGDS
ncbi:helix-turn-helix domain-containing protein [Bacillus sp. ISL-47]|uniref:helix-turn-helix domain-containing protein n=1 Tax=Bacillus sp. ISL-47 TaxID=2819130 RepID=UPI001BE9ADE7|nr:helix-turn-helix domain-containing protein [Bacillus sp. ISL-47]MBT2687720.1 helix-turn-helix domain-containing protein [Bacillus sp. ISL-47]MBT2710774.1 helix-turn-helix domain-containing protein [Pseudomonas sp. ISL-84]